MKQKEANRISFWRPGGTAEPDGSFSASHIAIAASDLTTASADQHHRRRGAKIRRRWIPASDERTRPPAATKVVADGRVSPTVNWRPE